MLTINRLDFLLVSLAFIFLLNCLAIHTGESEGLFVTVLGATVAIAGYAFIRPQITEAVCQQEVR